MHPVMTRVQLEDRVKAILIETVPELDIAQNQITLDTHLTQELALDSLAWAEFFMAIEDAFQVQISDEDTHTIETLKALVDYIENKRVI